MCACFDKLLFGAVEGGKEAELSDSGRKIRYPFGYLISFAKNSILLQTNQTKSCS